MRLATSTNLLFLRPDKSRLPLIDTMQRLAGAGFRILDLNFYDWSLPGSPFLTDNWEGWIEEIICKKEELGLEFKQCHGYFYSFLSLSMSEEEREYHNMLQMRSFECLHRLGAQIVVLHPETVPDTVSYVKKSYEANKRYFDMVLENTSKYGFLIAVENMCDYSIAPKRKFCAYPDELADFISGFGSKRMGICWDFEHADIMEQDQKESLYIIKEYLLATHVSDTYSKTDNTLMHVLPMTGTINWKEVVGTLHEINYTGDFCFEVHNYLNKLPDEVVDTGLKLAYEIGMHLLRS